MPVAAKLLLLCTASPVERVLWHFVSGTGSRVYGTLLACS